MNLHIINIMIVIIYEEKTLIRICTTHMLCYEQTRNSKCKRYEVMNYHSQQLLEGVGVESSWIWKSILGIIIASLGTPGRAIVPLFDIPRDG